MYSMFHLKDKHGQAIILKKCYFQESQNINHSWKKRMEKNLSCTHQMKVYTEWRVLPGDEEYYQAKCMTKDKEILKRLLKISFMIIKGLPGTYKNLSA